MFARCRRDHGCCEKHGLIVYPCCASGYFNVGCCICSPNCPNGFTDFGVSCVKPSYGRGVGKLLSCRGDQDFDAGLCYPKCRNSYTGVGPVCWGRCPSHLPHNCGAGCAVTASFCTDNIIDQVWKPVEMVLNAAAKDAKGAAAAGAEACQAYIWPVCP